MFVSLDEHPKIRLRWATALLLVVMSSVAVWEALLEPAQRGLFIRTWGTVPSQLFSEQAADASLRVFKLFSALFVHVDTAHLLGNLLFLTLFGFAVEKVFRSRLVLLLFLTAGVIANLVAAVLLVTRSAPIVGASGAVSGLIGAYLFLFPRASRGLVLPLGLYFQFVRVPALYLIGLWFFLQVLYTVAGPGLSAVAWLAHVIGFITGFVLAALLRPLFYRSARARILN